jgi:hypothetical protein
MLLNVYQRHPVVIPGTRLLEATLGVVGVRIPDPEHALRAWEVQGLYMPIEGRALGGVRAKLIDQKGFITFCNQRDLEVLLGIGQPGLLVEWRDDAYVGPGDREWCGLCCDEDDLLDDLQEREMFLRAQLPAGVLVPNLEMERRVHLHGSYDCEESYLVTHDSDPETGLFPDTRFETIERRWIRSERRRVRWDRS